MTTNLAYIYDHEDYPQAGLEAVQAEPEWDRMQAMPLSANVAHYNSIDDDECCNLYMVPG